MDGSWTSWSTWDNCVDVCKTNETTQRYRECTDPNPVGTGKNCTGVDHEVEKCDDLFCSGKVIFEYVNYDLKVSLICLLNYGIVGLLTKKII